MQTILVFAELMIAVALIVFVLLQRSAGGALGMGGGPSGFMTARGAGDLLTRTTWILAAIFFSLALALTLLSGHDRGAASVVERLKVDAINPATLNKPTPAQQQPAGQPGAPQSGSQTAPAPFQAPKPTVRNPLLGETPAPGQQPTTPPAQR